MASRSNTTTARPVANLAAAAIGIAAMVGLGAWGLSFDTADVAQQSPAKPAADASPQADRAAADGPVRTSCGFDVGDTAAFKVAATTDVEFNPGPAMAALTKGAGQHAKMLRAQRSKARGAQFWRLDVQALDVQDGTTILAAQVRDVRVNIEESTGPKMDDPVAALGAIDQPFLMRLNDRCELVEFAWRREGDRAGAYNQQVFVAGLDAALPQDADAITYTHDGFNAHGAYQARYTVESPALIQGKVLKYTRSYTQGMYKNHGGTQVAASSLRLVPGDGPWFEALTTTETLKLVFDGKDLGHNTSSLHAQHTDFKPLASDLNPEDKGWIWGSLLEASPVQAVAYAKDSIFGDLTTMSLSDALTHLMTVTPKGQPGIRAYLEFMTNWLRLHPEAVAELLDVMRGDAFALKGNILASELLTLAMARANTDTTRAALMTLSGDGYHHDVQYQALRALSDVSPMPEGYLDQVLAHMNNPDSPLSKTNGLQLLVGEAAKNQATLDPETAAKLNAQVKTWLSDATTSDDPNAIRGALGAAGNSGNPELIEHIDPYFQDANPDTRSAAARAMRNMPYEAATAKLAAHINDPETGVRINVMRTLYDASAYANTAPPADIIDPLAANLGNVTHVGELEHTLRLLAAAGRQGNDAASDAIASEMQAAMQDPQANHDRIITLGRYQPSAWSAQP